MKANWTFTCTYCGSNNLGYQKYVKCVTPVETEVDGTLVYLPSLFDEEDSIYPVRGFMCLDCGEYITHCGLHMETEDELESYYALDPQERDRQQREHDEVSEAIAESQEQRRQEIMEAMACELDDSGEQKDPGEEPCCESEVDEEKK